MTFSDYFRLRASTEDVLAYFGYQKRNEEWELPRTNQELPVLESLRDRIKEALIHISLENEITRREFLIAPVMFEVRRFTESKLRSEYWFEYNHQLKGTLDYYLRRENNLLVIEAKQADLNRGFTQLAVEMVALDKADEFEQNKIYGAISTGEEWRFGYLDRIEKTVVQDINLYGIPSDLEAIVRTLIGILEVK